jgi:hypothetical protein
MIKVHDMHVCECHKEINGNDLYKALYKQYVLIKTIYGFVYVFIFKWRRLTEILKILMMTLEAKN